jgi:uncharacterized membrane protein/Mg-chelatase subunit ChlD
VIQIASSPWFLWLLVPAAALWCYGFQADHGRAAWWTCRAGIVAVRAIALALALGAALLGLDLAPLAPWYLLLLLLVPWLWWSGFDSLSGLARYRAFLAVSCRTAALLAVVLALSEAQHLRRHDRLTVIYLLDQSASIPQPQRDAMFDYARAEVARHRDDRRRDRAALIVFGRDARLEIPPVDDNLPLLRAAEGVSDLEPDATNLAEALKLAQAVLPEDSACRLVIISDGNENQGDARSVARVLSGEGVGLDVVPIELPRRADVAVDKLVLPPEVRRGQPLDALVVMNHRAGAGGEAVRGTLKVFRRAGRVVATIGQRPVELAPGKSAFEFRSAIESPDFYEYQALFVPDDPTRDDLLPQNNRATAFTQVLGPGHILLIEDWEHRGEFDPLVQRWRQQDLQVTVQGSDSLFADLAELQRYDAVVLANVPRNSGSDSGLTSFSDAQIRMLIHNTENLGCGLVMIGGPRSFGAGGWSNSPLEQAMPVDFQVDSPETAPVGAVAMVMHASEMAQGNYWQKVIARRALEVLGPRDYCGIVHWTGREEWLWDHPQGLVRVGPHKAEMLAQLGRMTPGDMPEFDPSLIMAARSFAQLPDAAVKQMIVISDGDPVPPTAATLQMLRPLGVKISTVAVGTHGPPGNRQLQRMAVQTGGTYYVVEDPRSLPAIFQKETSRVARPLVQEKPGLVPQVTYRHEILQGIDRVPPIDGFVLTSVKPGNLAEVSLRSPEPPDQRHAALLATWTYGAGRTAVLTTDAGQRWATAWRSWPDYDRFFAQLIRWAMRPPTQDERFSVATQVNDGVVRVVVTAVDQDGQAVNFLPMSANLVRPDGRSETFTIRQVAPGRYVGQFGARSPGSYFVAIQPGPGLARLRAGVNVPYSAEYRDRQTNLALLTDLARMKPRGGRAGEVIAGHLAPDRADEGTRVNTYRRTLAPAVSTSTIWPSLVVLAGCLFLADVCVRRVDLSSTGLPEGLRRLRAWLERHPTTPEPDARLERLRNRKAQIQQRIDERRAAARYDAPPEQTSPSGDGGSPSARPAGPPPPTEEPAPPAADEGYTARLLKAKREAAKLRRPPSPEDPGSQP